MKQKVGLFFGSFDPIHNGHIQIINHPHFSQFDQIWLMITPESPFKKGKVIAAFHHRLSMVKMSLGDNKKFVPSDLECQLASPYYTANTLMFLQANYSDYNFEIIMGSDNYINLENGKWYKSEFILNNFKIIVYPRVGTKIKPNSSLTLLNSALISTSSTDIRLSLLDTPPAYSTLPLPKLVQEYIKTQNLYSSKN